jgi:hypothetical protein
MYGMAKGFFRLWKYRREKMDYGNLQGLTLLH